MGLDVYLRRATMPATDALAERDRLSSTPGDEERREKFEEATFADVADMPSKIHPDHLFKLTYWRSSYNEGGFDHVMREAIGVSLDAIVFGGGGDDSDYFRAVDWTAALTRARAAKEAFAAFMEEAGPYWSITHTAISLASVPESDADPLKAFLAERKRAKWDSDDRDDFVWYTNRGGMFFRKNPPTVHAVTVRQGRFGPEAHLIVSGDDEGGSHYDFYAQALDVVIETIEWVLAQENPNHYLFAWSG